MKPVPKPAQTFLPSLDCLNLLLLSPTYPHRASWHSGPVLEYPQQHTFLCSTPDSTCQLIIKPSKSWIRWVCPGCQQKCLLLEVLEDWSWETLPWGAADCNKWVWMTDMLVWVIQESSAADSLPSLYSLISGMTWTDCPLIYSPDTPPTLGEGRDR